MINKTELLFERINQIAKNEKERMQTDEEFAFASGQLIRKILSERENESESINRKLSLLEPFLQKKDAKSFKLAIARAFLTCMHAFKFYESNKRYSFERIISETMGFEPDEKDIKNLLPLIFAGYFSETVFEKDETKETGLTEPILKHKSKKDKTANEMGYTYDVICTDPAKRILAANCYKAGMPIEQIMPITGHTIESEFLTYIADEIDNPGFK